MTATPAPPKEFLDRIAEHVAVDPTSPTGLAWKSPPTGVIARPGSPAGLSSSRRPARLRFQIKGVPVERDTRAVVDYLTSGERPARTRRPPPLALASELSDLARQRREEREARYGLGDGPLASLMKGECVATGSSIDDLTVMSPRRDPFRLDIEEMRAAGQWFAAHHAAHIGEERHLREIHYVLGSLNLAKPNGEPYRNEWSDWRWLIDVAAKGARWLGYVPWDRIVDVRLEEPNRHRQVRVGAVKVGSLAVTLEVPGEIDVTPTPMLEGYHANQPYALAMFTEKAAATARLDPLCERFGVDLYVSIGDLVDRRLWEIARDAAGDGRKLILFTVADCDPGGWNMPVALSRKLQALAVEEFPALRFEVVRAGLTPDQVTRLELPSTPVKQAEKRADKWRSAFGVGQTELDAALALRGNAFAAEIEAAIGRYFDPSLPGLAAAAERTWQRAAVAAVAAAVDADEIEELQDRYEAARAEIGTINEQLEEIADRIRLPVPPEPPEPDPTFLSQEREPLIDSDWGFVEGTLRLRADKAYGEDDDTEATP